MLDPNALSQLVQQEIQASIQKEVDSIVKQTDWIAELERQIVEHVQNRITARFSNISTVPDLVSTVEQSVETLFKNGFVPDISEFVKAKNIQKSVDIAVENFVKHTLDNLTVDPQWVEKIQTLVNQTMVDKLKQSINGVDVNQTLTEIIVDNKQTILAEFANNFATNGISDTASETQLTVMNDAVVVENELHTNDLNVERNTNLKGDLLVEGDLAVKGRVNVDNPSWQRLADHIGNKTYDRVKQDFESSVVDSVFDQAKSGFQFENVIVDGEYLFKDGSLAKTVKESSLTKVGTLQNLNVSGRIGINTENPSDALSVWDEEVSLCAGKHSANTAFIGTTKNQNLVIGTNKQRQLEVNKDGGVWVDQLTVGKNRIGHSRGVPNYSGTKGDIVFNIDMKPDQPFAWICLGAFRWQQLRAS